MCEMFVATAAAGFRLETLWPFADLLERYGIAGFGWGVAWTSGSALSCHVSVDPFRADPARDILGGLDAVAALVHFRRPSRLSTLGRADAQPFVDPGGRFAFAHNGDFRDYRPLRARYAAAGRIRGRADSEVGMRWLEDAWGETGDGSLLPALHRELGGEANTATLVPSGAATVYAGNPENPVFGFRSGAIDVVSTGIYSLDRSLFRYVAPGATGRRLVRLGEVIRAG